MTLALTTDERFARETLPNAETRQSSRALNRQAAAWLFFTVICAFVAMIARVGEVTHDAFHEMALFREFVQSGTFPTADLFAYTPTVNPTVHHEWGTGAVLYLVSVSTGWGLGGLTLLKSVLIGTLWLLLYRVARLRGVHPYLFACLALAVFPLLWVGFATVRATLFTLVCLSAQLWMHEHDRRGGRLWLLLWWCMLVVWLNLHAGFVVGVGLLAFHACERFIALWLETRSMATAWRATWHLALAAPLVILALPINPYGWQYVPYLIRALTMPRPLIAEWLPLWHTYDPVFTIALFVLSIAIIAIGIRRQPLGNLIGLLGLCICALLALKHLRHGAIYSVVWIAYAPAWLSHTSLGKDVVQFIQRHARPTIGLCQVLVAGMLIWCSLNGFGQATLTGDPAKQSTCYPVAAVEYLREHEFHGNLLTPFHAGAYVSWTMYPQVKVSLDGRYEVAYAPPVFEEHCEFFKAGPQWSTLLEKYPHDAILVHQSAKVRPLLERFGLPKADPSEAYSAWEFVFEDDAYVILARPALKLPYVNHRARASQPSASSSESLARAH